jgi:hypothetical protein
MNFILSNGDRSKQIDEKYPTEYTFMMPADAHNKIRSVTIYYRPKESIGGFSFFDKDGALLWKHGFTYVGSGFSKETVEIAENERIIGVKAKLFSGWQSIYSDWQFQIGKFV